MARQRKQDGPGDGSIKLTWWAAKNTWQKVIGKTGAYDGQEGGYAPAELVSSRPKKWYLGPDRATAEVAAHRLTQLWQDLQAMGLQAWNEQELYLRAAEAIKNGEYAVEVEPGPFEHVGREEYVAYLDELNRRHRCIRFLPANPQVYQQGQAGFARLAEQQAVEARRTAALVGVSPRIASKGTPRDGGWRIPAARA